MPLRPPPPPLMLASRPLLAVSGAVGCGVAVAAATATSPWTWVALGGGVTVLAGLAVRRERRRLVTLTALTVAAAVLVGAFALGALRMATWRSLPPDHVAWVARQAPAVPNASTPELTVWARVATAPTASPFSIRFTATVDSGGHGGTRAALRGPIQVSLMRQPDADVQPVYPALRLGDRVRLTGHLVEPAERRNPAQMDYAAFLRGRGIHATMRIEDEAAAVFLGPSPHLRHHLALDVQRRVRRAVDRHVPHPDARSALLALLLADRSEIDPEALDAFRATGLMHLLAVSGLHVLFVGLALYAFLKPVLGRLGLRRRTVEWSRTLLTIGVLGLYVLVTGAPVSVVRAFVMAAILVVGRAAERRVDALNSLGGAALVLLLLRPTTLFEVGFQLSFSAVAALVTLGPLLTSAVPERLRRGSAGAFLSGSVVASTAATLGTGPVLLAHFGLLPLGGLVLNVPAIPLTGAALGGGLATVLTADWAPPLADLFGAFASGAAWLLFRVSDAGASGLGWAALAHFVRDPTTLLALALGLGALALWRRPTARTRLALAAAGCLAIGLWASVLRGERAPRLDLLFLDVGQGDATLIRLPNGRHVLIDAGIRSPFTDHGTRTILPHLARYGIDRLDALVLTHADADHIGGAVAVLDGVPVGRVLHNGQRGETDLWDEVFGAADSLGIPTARVSAGDTLALDPTVRLRILGPSDALARAGDSNEASVVVMLEYGRTRALLTGDAEHAGEAELVARYGPLLRADVVKVGHHGSRTSSTPPLVAAVASGPVTQSRRTSTGEHASGPAYAVVSVALRNRYGLPNDEPLERWARTGAEVLQTAHEGAVWLRSDGRAYTRFDWRR